MPMPKIITVTANTAIDHVIALPPFALGDTVIAHSSRSFAAGKGINVAKALVSLNHPVIALGFVGQQSRHEFEALQSHLLKTDFTYVDSKTRSNITLTSNAAEAETHIRTTGYTVTAADCEHLFNQLKAHAEAGDSVVLSGSLPPGAPADFYKHLISICHLQGAKVILDSSGVALQDALSACPDLIKPNHNELEALMDTTLPDEPSIIAAAHRIVSQGIPCVVVSRGSKGALAVTAKQVISATLASPPPPTQIISTIGCGDAMVAGLALATLQNLELTAAFKLAMTCATANLFTAEPGRLDKKGLLDAANHIMLNSLLP